MAYRKLRPKQATDQEISARDSELSPEQVAAYLRQSSDFQATNNLESGLIQLSGARRFALSHGLDPDKILIAHEGEGKRGVSGTLRIDQRERLQEIMSGIYTGTIKLVWADNVSRLFRDPYGVQSGTFIEACAEHKVRVVIENAGTFDLRNSTDRMIFQMLVNLASKENEDRTRLFKVTRHNKALRGEYDGRPLTPGFIVDRDKDSPTYQKFIPYEPHAKVDRWLFKRYRELEGRFNLLWNEVADMPVLFLDFDSSVDRRDVHKLMLRKVPGGYHISKHGLSHLLASVEVAGYWKVGEKIDEQFVTRQRDTSKGKKGETRKVKIYSGEVLMEDGQPIRNHEAIVPFEDWHYAFKRMSWNLLDSSDNPERVNMRATWTPSGKENRALLQGILTSPQGTVNYSDGHYRIAERRNPNTSERSNTLLIDGELIDINFLLHLKGRYLKIGMKPYDIILEELKRARERNAQAMVSVPKQLEQWDKVIASRKAKIDALGEDIDVELLKQYNKEIKEARAHKQELIDKQNAATVEESKLVKLHQGILQLSRGGKVVAEAQDPFEDMELTRTFIGLACDSITIEEYSLHFAKLTVTWSEPFHQVDVCWIYLPNGTKEPWSDADLADLERLFPHADRKEILERFPTRSWVGIYSYASDKPRNWRRSAKAPNSSKLDKYLALRDQEVIDRIGSFDRDASIYARVVWVIDAMGNTCL